MYVKVKVTANAREEKFEKESDTEYVIFVREKAEQNQANRRVLELVREHLSQYGTKIRIISGHHSPHKIISIDR